MPLYEYRCSYCDHLFERLNHHDSDLPLCPVCNSETVKIFSQSSFRLKGAGFHANDYTRYSRKNVNKTS
ncbi:FmdB family zinc ribbon protein [candidate division KSB1 bacterium]